MAFVDRSLASAIAARHAAASPSPLAGKFNAARFGVAPVAAPVEAAAEPAILPRNRFRDLTALALLAGCLFLVAALATFDPADPPVSYGFPPHARATNACGFLGAAAASALYEWFGLGAWLAVAAVAGCDLMLLRRRAMPDLPLRTAGGIVAVVGVCTLLAMFLPDWVVRPIWGPGGHAGGIGRHFSEGYFAKTGAAIIVTTISGVGLFLACDTLVLRAVSGMTAALVGLTTAFVAGVSHIGARIGSRSRAENSDDADIATAFPGLRLRTPAAGDDEEDNIDDDAVDAAMEDDSEPAIRVRRREKPVVAEAPVVEDEEDLLDDSVGEPDEDTADEEELAPAEASRAAVPIKSLASRRRKSETIQMAPDPTANYELPSLELLLPAEQLQLDEQEQEVRDRARVLEKTFGDFGFKVRVVEIETGPVISQYEIELEAGLRLAKIANLADDLAIALRVPSVRIVAPIPGKNSVGIEVPNTTRQMVRLREVIEESQSRSRTMKIPLYFGKDVAGNPMVFDMASLPHLLIAGRTGTGKSVCLNSIIVSMLMTRRPDEVRMLMIDPKMVELTPYKALPHLMHPVVTDMKKAEAILAWAVEKMEERYTMLAKVGVRHLSQYNQLGREELLKRFNLETDEEAAAIPTTMPYIVVIADEIADMMMTAGKEIEQHIIRLAQKSRAVGIHLILATQKPTVDVITGLIKSNLPARIAFQVASRTDSRVVLDECGAERLLGNGDMLFLSPGTSQILRGQGTYLSDEEIGRVMAAIGTTEPQYAEELVNLQPAPSGDAPKGSAGKDRDEMYEAAVEVVIREGRGSVSLLQRALGVGYGRGARLIDFMAEDGVVGQYAGSQAREVLLTMDQWAERNGTTAPAPDPAPRRLKIQPHAAVVEQFEEIEEDDDEAADRDQAFARLKDDDDSDLDDGDEEEADDNESDDETDENDGEYEDAEDEDEDDSDEESDDDD
ncbi:MAG: DNA translocase FtsK [Planctomycetia bacterium]|nr:DNA translocase FtsK [Planctomycetia bacterium]